MMKKSIFNATILASALAISTFTACKKNENPDDNQPETTQGADTEPRKYITLTAAFPDEAGTAGNGGTLAYSITEEEAKDASKTINIFSDGYALRSQRTARVQASANGNHLYNIQYTGESGGTFNKYHVQGAGNFADLGKELDISTLIDASPRWVKAAEGLGIAVKITGTAAPIDPVKAEAGTQTYEYVRGAVKLAVIDLDGTKVINSTEFDFPFSDEEKEAGYSVGRIDVPILNKAQNKIFIGCNIAKVDPNKAPEKTTNRTGETVWSWPADDNNIKGTVTLVLDYPSLGNPKLIWSTQSKYGNNSYRTMSQYIGTDGHVYQSTGANTTSYPHILRIDKNTNDYDNTYLFDLADALNITSGRVGIKAWTYIKDGKAIALYDIDSKGGYIALLDLNAKTATKISNQYESNLTLSQFQNLAVAGDYAYLPLTPSGMDGTLYLVNWKNGTATAGAKLKGQSGSYYIGSY